MKIYEIIKQLRIDSDKTQQEIADVLNIYREQYYKYEAGRQELPLRHLATLCRYYGVSADYVLGLPRDLTWPR